MIRAQPQSTKHLNLADPAGEAGIGAKSNLASGLVGDLHPTLTLLARCMARRAAAEAFLGALINQRVPSDGQAKVGGVNDISIRENS